jgi:hypothetical protein
MSMEIKLRYDGRYEGLEELGDMRSYTIRSHTIVNGRDLFNCTYTGAKNLMAVLRGESI